MLPCSGRGRVNYEDLTESELRDLNQLCRKFLQGDADVEHLPTDTLKSIKETYKQMRLVFQSVKSELMAAVAAGGQQAAAAAAVSHYLVFQNS